METAAPHCIFVGTLRKDYVVTPREEVFLDQPGGSALYAAVGALVWNPKGCAIAVRVGEDFPRGWIEAMSRRGLDVRGVRIIPGSHPVVEFRSFTSWDFAPARDPVRTFAHLGRDLPRDLVNYASPNRGEESRETFPTLSPRASDLPSAYLSARGVHLAPSSYLTHLTLPVRLRESGIDNITLDPCLGYMEPALLKDLPSLLHGISAVITSERKMRSLFRERTHDLKAAAEHLCSFGPKVVLIDRGSLGLLVYDSHSRQHRGLPAYEAMPRDPTGAGDALAGGFLFGWLETFDPVEAALRGSVSASLVIEGPGAWFALERRKDLAAARLQSLRQRVERL